MGLFSHGRQPISWKTTQTIEWFHDNDNIRHIMNNRKSTEEQKCKLVEIDKQERKREKNFMKRVKTRWDTEYPASRRTAQVLTGNARRLKKEG